MHGTATDLIARATRLVQDGALSDASRLVMWTLADHPGSAIGLTLAGHIAVRRSALEVAVRSFDRALRADQSESSRALLNLARAQEMAGRTADALATAQRAASRFPADPKVQALNALLLAAAGQVDAAATQILAAGGAPTIEPDTALKLGIRLVEVEQHRALALDLLEHAARTPGRQLEPATHAFVGWLTPGDKRTHDAARRALILQPDAIDAMDAMDRALLERKNAVRRAAWVWQSCCVKSDDISRVTLAARLTHDVKWPGHGIAANQRLLERHPNNHDIIVRICSLFVRDLELAPDKQDVTARAQAWVQKVVGGKPSDPRIWDAVACLCKDVRAIPMAHTLWRQAIERFPDFEVLHYNRALFLDEQELMVEAERSFWKALVLRPGYQRASNVLSLSLSRQHRLHEALLRARRGVLIHPAQPSCWMNYGSHLRALGRYTEAIVAYHEGERYGKLLGDKEQEAGARFNCGMTHLSIGELETGFKMIEARWATRDFPSPRRNFKQPIWRGPRQHPNSGVLIYLEQGLGDEVMMTWYMPLLRRDTSRLVVDCDARLVDICSRTYEGVEFVARSLEGHPSTRGKDIRYKVPVLHVPQYYAPELKFLIRENWDWAERRGDRFPARLVVGEERLRRWDRWFEERYPGRRRLSLSWRSKVRNRARDLQYISIEDVARALPDGCVAINLQYSSTPDEIERLSELVRDRDIDVITPEGVDLTNDLDDIFAILQVSDAAVTPMISLAWMAGAVGCPGYIFRTSRERSTWHQFGTPFLPWAPSMRLFFRDPSENWDPVVQDIRSRLTRFLDNPPDRFC